MEGEAGASYSPVRSSVVLTGDMEAPGTMTRDEGSKKSPVNSSLVVALGMSLTVVQPLKHVDQNFLFEGPFGQEASCLCQKKVNVNLPLRMERFRSNKAFRTSIEV